MPAAVLPSPARRHPLLAFAGVLLIGNVCVGAETLSPPFAGATIDHRADLLISSWTIIPKVLTDYPDRAYVDYSGMAGTDLSRSDLSDPRAGSVRHNSIATTVSGGTHYATIRDEVRIPFAVSSSGEYSITASGTYSGRVVSAGAAVIANWGSYYSFLQTRTLTGDGEPVGGSQGAWRGVCHKEHDIGAVTGDVATSVFGLIVGLVSGGGWLISGVSVLAEALTLAHDLQATEEWPDTRYSMRNVAYLESGRTYYLSLVVESESHSGASLGQHHTSVVLSAQLAQIDIAPSSGPAADTTPPLVTLQNLSDSFSQPTTIDQRVILSAYAQDPESGVEPNSYHFVTWQRSGSSWIDARDWGVCNGTVAIGPLDRGSTYRVQARATNGAGMTGTSGYGYIAVPAAPRTIYVDDDYTSGTSGWGHDRFAGIQDAIDAAVNGETRDVVVREGIYYENVRFNGKAVNLTSTNPYDSSTVAKTVIDGARGDGGGSINTLVHFSDSETTTSRIAGFTIRNGGPGVYSYESSPVVAHNVIRGNHSDLVQVSGVQLILSGAHLIGNRIVGNVSNHRLIGGAVHCYRSDIALTDNDIIGNSGERSGGISIESSAVAIRGGRIASNSSTFDGGGLDVYDGSTVTVEGVTVSDNVSQWDAGGIDVRGGSTIAVRDCRIEANKGGSGLGGVAIKEGSSIVALGTSLLSNVGGGMEIMGGSDGSITACSFEGNESMRTAGGLYVRDGVGVTVTRTVFRDNIADDGGALYAGTLESEYASVILDSCLFRGNRTADETGTGHGGAISVGTGAEVALRHCVMDSNKADWGGAISLWRGRVTVTSSLIVNNYADWGAAMTVVHPSAAATLNRCTISGNAGLSYGGAISLAESSYVSLRNSILRNEGIGEIRSSFISGWGSGTVEVGHCNVESLHSTFDAGDNIDADPLFMNAGAGDYRLQAGSPCIDTGDPSSGMDPDGSRVDMGAIPFGSAHPLTVSDLPQPTGLILAQNAPNPFNPSTTIRYTVPVDDIAYMAIYDVSGRHVRTLVDRRVAAGEHSVVWDGHDDTGRQAASGVYLYRLKTRDFVQARRLTLIR